jgi:uncharacterized protein YceH (UPF0502 family)
VNEVELELEELMTRPDGPFVARLSREPGRRESRYMHLFSGDAPPELQAGEESGRPAAAGTAVDERLARLEADVAALRHELEALKSQA